MMRWVPISRSASLLAISLVLAACGQDDGAEGQAAQAEPSDVWSFASVSGGDAGAMDDRLPGSPSQTILVPATTLFPGAARVNPEIENPYAGDAEAIAAGERHFAAFNCAGCHAPLGGGGMGPPLSDDAWIYGDEPAQIYLTIVHGRPQGMPAFGSMLPARTIWELVAYIKTLPEIEDPAARKGFDPARGRFQADDPELEANAQVEQ